ncbi:uncharacterized protein PAC_11409 [Phialocephala subalpina]|uniref:Uncharacterized protein n=1 Tax=Phialocephala subalpina TaxID=576137 RepID=A0A1L7X921_9HELO|nr:uncharacterized protein PAC_11409 [Phialocephala subalpina]
MHLTSVFLLTALPLTLGLPLQARDTPSLTLPDPPLPTASLTPSQIQALACVCQDFLLSGLLTSIPGADPIHTLCAGYPASLCTSSTSSSSGGTSIPLQGGVTSALGNVGDVSSVASGLLGSLPIGAIAKEKRDSELEGRQTTSSTTGGGFSLPNIPDLGLGDVGTAVAVLSGVENSAPGLIGTVGTVTSLLGAGGLPIVAREAEQEREKRQLDGLTAPIAPVAGGLLPTSNPIASTVTGLVGELTSGLTGSSLLSGVPFVARDTEPEPEEKRQLGDLIDPVSIVTGLVGSLAGGLTGSSGSDPLMGLTGSTDPLSGVTGSLAGGAGGVLSGVPVVARDAEEKEKRQLGGLGDSVSIVTGLVGSLTGGLTGGSSSDPLTDLTGGSDSISGITSGLTGGSGSFTGGLPIVGNNGLGGISGIAR